MRPDKRILIVDDDDAIRALLHTVLRRRGFLADSARNGVEAMERLTEQSYALVLLDIMMPRMSGFEVLRHLGARSPTQQPLVIVLTAGMDPRPLDTTLVIGTMHKPFDIELLVDTIVGCLSQTEAATAENAVPDVPVVPIDDAN